MSNLRQARDEARHRWPLHEPDPCDCYCPSCVGAQLKRQAYIDGRTVTLDQVDAAAQAVHTELIRQVNTSAVTMHVYTESIDLERDLARAALKASGVVILDPIGMEHQE